MVIFWQSLVLLVLFTVQSSFGKPRQLDALFDVEQDKDDTCKKDILLIVDMTRSISRNTKDFDNMKKFVIDFVKSKSLDIGKYGVHVAFMIFSENKERGREVQDPVKGNEKTKMVVEFGQSASYNKMELVEEINKAIVRSALGGSTRTDVALRLANKELPQNSSSNHRKGIDDVVILVTDGAPSMRYFPNKMNTKIILEKQADDLKNKGVKVIGVGIGIEFTEKKGNKKLLQKLSSPNQFYSVRTEELNNIIGSLVAKSCNIQRATCECPDTRSGTYFLKPGQSTIKIDYFDGKPKCDSNNVRPPNPKVEPAEKISGSKFRPGDHNITYTYQRTRTTNKLVCKFEIYVRDCSCTSSSIGPSLTVPTGQNEMEVSWTVPKPKCPEAKPLFSDTESEVTKTLKIGEHSYVYRYEVGSGKKRFIVACPVEFEIKECTCSSQVLNPQNVKPGEIAMNVFWSKPRPNCPEAAQLIREPREQPGQSFPIGYHTMKYVYNINNQFDLKCRVSFEIKGALCRDKGFDAANQVCCCGTIHNKRYDHQCCGQDYYKTSTQKCCPNSVVRRKNISCPRQ